MDCDKCGQKIPEGFTGCPNCGAGVVGGPRPQPRGNTGVSVISESSPSTRGVHLFMIISIVVLLALAVGVSSFVIWYFRSPGRVLGMVRKNVDAVESLHFTLEEKVSAQGQEFTISATGDMTAKGDFQMSGQMTGIGAEAMGFEEILTEGTLYMKSPYLGSDWVKISTGITTGSPQQGMTGGTNPDDFLQYFEAIGDIETLSDESIRGVDCYHYSIDVDEEELISVLEEELGESLDESGQKDVVKEMFEESSLELEVWIGKDDNLPYKEKVKMTVKKPVEMAIDATIEFSDFNKEVNIQAPAGARDFQSLQGGM